MNVVEGLVPVKGGNVWYKIVGEGTGIPLLVVHGGPGYPHDYLLPLADLSTDRKVIFYDQLGCGNSDKTIDPTLWTIENFVAELQSLIQQLKIEKYHLLGQSWGTAVAVAFALTQPKGLVCLLLSDPFLSTPLWVKDAERLKSALPQHMQEALCSDESSEAFALASKEYYARYVQRLKEIPEAFTQSGTKMNRDLYRYMWGTKEFKPTGTLLSFDITSRLPEIAQPTLLLCGRYDEATPEACEYFKSLLPNAKVNVFEYSAHFPFWDEREEYMQIVRQFLIGLPN